MASGRVVTVSYGRIRQSGRGMFEEADVEYDRGQVALIEQRIAPFERGEISRLAFSPTPMAFTYSCGAQAQSGRSEFKSDWLMIEQFHSPTRR